MLIIIYKPGRLVLQTQSNTDTLAVPNTDTLAVPNTDILAVPNDRYR